MSDPLIRKVTERVLKKEALKGQTTLAGASALCMKEVNSEKVSKALLMTALHDLFKREITHQLKRHLAPSNGVKILPRVPPEIVRRLPQWFSTGEGPGAVWVPSPLATIDQIKASRDLRYKKIDETQHQAEFLDDLIAYLMANDCTSLDGI